MEMVEPLSQIRHSATVEILSQQSSGVCSVSQSRGGPLHVGEGADEGGGVRDVVDGGLLYTEPGDRHGDLTVGVALVGLGDNLVDVAGDVGRDGGELRSVLEILVGTSQLRMVHSIRLGKSPDSSTKGKRGNSESRLEQTSS